MNVSPECRDADEARSQVSCSSELDVTTTNLISIQVEEFEYREGGGGGAKRGLGVGWPLADLRSCNHNRASW